MTLLRNVEFGGTTRDVAFGSTVGVSEDGVTIDGLGGALLPGLHDHHLHLRALAAARTSVNVRGGLAALRDAPGSGWIRAVGADGVTRSELDAVVPDRPVRVQHRSGHAWALNTAGLRSLGLDVDDGIVVGDLPRLGANPDLTRVGTELAAYGITAVTDATPGADAGELGSLIPQRVSVLRKVLAPAHEIPDAVRSLRPGPVAVHCTTRAELVVALTVVCAGDRIEHAGVTPPELISRLPVVVTQPGFIADRGDDYRREVEPEDLPHLYRYRSLLDAGVPTVASSDAPFGPLDPWAVIRAARDRLTPAGHILGPHERVAAGTALSGYLCSFPGSRTKTITPGIPADLVLLHVPLAEALTNPTTDHVRHTWIGGELIR